ncbi:MAG: hypothetical protein QMD32_08365, partial [Smithellaceae bacterium]|nr:hypothetical protein [Smithellaceae bacterium]
SDPYLGAPGADPCAFNIACQGLSTTGASFQGVGYLGTIAGLALNNSLRGMGRAIYIRPTGETGYLKMDAIGGVFSPGLGTWAAAGNITAFPQGTTSISPGDLYHGSSYLSTKSFDADVGRDSMNEGPLSGYLSGESYQLSGQPWGIATFGVGGTFVGVPAGAWSAKVGKREFDYREGDYFYYNYWISTIAGQAWDWDTEMKSFSGRMTGREMNIDSDGDHYLASFTGDILGTYITGITGEPDAYRAIGLAAWTETRLKYVSHISSDGWHGDGILLALAGGTASLFGSAPAALIILGEYDGPNRLYQAPFFSLNFQTGDSTTFDADPGAYEGFSSLVMDSKNNVYGGLIALYLGPNRQVGYLRGSSITGQAYPDLGLFEADGTINRLAVSVLDTSTGITAANFHDKVSATPPLSVNFAAGSAGFRSETRHESWITLLPSWGIWQTITESDFASFPPAAWSWTTAHQPDVEKARYWTNHYDITRPGGPDLLLGSVAGAKADWVSAATYIGGGEIRGLYNPDDPDDIFFKAISQGAWMETGKFVDMAADTSPGGGRDKLLQLNIPAIEVGIANLVQDAGTVNGLTGVTMNNVTFFANSTGGVPRIWATTGVTGSYSTTPTIGGNAVPLAGGGLTATFGINNWSGDKWGANVNGSGTLTVGSYNNPINFTGGAAGTFTGSTSGSLTGTAAGVVVPPGI